MLHVKLDIQRFAVSSSISYSVQSQDPATNTSVVRLTFTVKRTSGSTYWSDGKTLTFTCDGQTGTTSFNFPSGSVGYTKSASYDFTITHNNDGTKYIAFSARIVTGTSAGTLNPTGEANLPVIPRYTTTTNWSIASKTETSITLNWSTANNCSQIRYGISTSSYNTINVSGSSGQVTISGLTANTPYNFYFMPKRSDSGLWGNGSSDNWSVLNNQYTYDYPKASVVNDITLRADTTFTIGFSNPLQKTFDYEIISNVDSSVIYAEQNVNITSVTLNVNDIMDDFYETIPNAKEGTYYVKTTYSGNIRNSESKKYIIDADTCKPIMSVVDYEDTNDITLALTGDDQTLILGYSTIQVTVPANNKATPRYGASIIGYIIKNGENQSSLVPEEEGEDVILSITATSGIIEVYAVDSREQSGIYQIVDTTTINYTPITKNQNPVAERTDDQGYPNGVGEYVKITLSGNYWSDSFGDVTNNITSVTYEYINTKNPSQPEQGTTTIVPITSDDTYRVSQLILGDTQHGFNIDNSYIINVTVRDELSSTSFTMTLASGTPHIAYSEHGVSIMGKYNEEAGGLFQIAGEPIQGGGGITGDTLPIGSIMPYGASIIPENWLECNGQAVSRTQYADLFEIIGTAFGTGDGTTTFNVPNFNTRVPVGYDNNDSDFNVIGKTGGEKKHTLVEQELPSISGSFSIHGQENGTIFYNTSGKTTGTVMTNKYKSITTTNTGANSLANPGFAFGGNQAHNILQPYITTKYIIKAFQSAGVIAEVSNTYSESTTKTYSCDYINGEVLYENVNGTNGDISLDDSINNYRYVEIFYNRNNKGHTSSKVEVNNNSLGSISLMCSYIDSNLWRLYSRNIAINGTNLTNITTNSLTMNINTDSSIFVDYNDTHFHITKVIGYK